MRVVYYGKELYHTATGAQRDDHKYIERIPVGDHFRYFYNQAQLAAYNAGKNIQGAVDAAKNTVDKFLHPTFEAGEDRYYDTNHPKNNQGIAGMTGKNNAPKYNQGVNITTGKNNAPKYNQGIAGMTGKNNTPKYNQGIAGMTGKNNAPKDNQGVNITTGKNNAPKNNQGYVSKSSPESNAPKVSGNTLKPRSAEEMRKQGEPYYSSKRVGNDSFTAGSGRLDSGDVDKFHVNTTNKPISKAASNKQESAYAGKKALEDLQNSSPKKGSALLDAAEKDAEKKINKTKQSKSKQLKTLENSYYQAYIKDGHSPADAKRWAKNAAENYMKKHK